MCKIFSQVEEEINFQEYLDKKGEKPSTDCLVRIPLLVKVEVNRVAKHVVIFGIIFDLVYKSA